MRHDSAGGKQLPCTVLIIQRGSIFKEVGQVYTWKEDPLVCHDSWASLCPLNMQHAHKCTTLANRHWEEPLAHRRSALTIHRERHGIIPIGQLHIPHIKTSKPMENRPGTESSKSRLTHTQCSSKRSRVWRHYSDDVVPGFL